MRLSDAIRLGAMLAPQGFGAYIHQFMGDDQTSCALGAAARAIDSQAVEVDEVVEALDAAFGTLLNTTRRRCPVNEHGVKCGVRRVTANVITHLNDDHRWTREQIADWVETLEPPVSPATGEPDDSGALDPVGVSGTERSTRA